MNFVFWKVSQLRKEVARLVEKKFNFNEIVSNVLAVRFQTYDLIEKNFEFKELENPFVMLGMDVAVKRLKKAVSAGETIAIYGDYDCDGVCASAILYSYLKRFTNKVLCYIPERSEGYGLNVDAIKFLKSKNVKLIVTVDNGIKAVKEAELIENLKMELIVTDHHNVSSELPKAVAILNPKQIGDLSKFKNICGAVVVLKLVAALEGGNFNFAFNFAGDLAALATIADLVPLVDENRVVVLKGIKQLSCSNNLGLLELLKLVFSNELNKVSSTDVAFKICPLINSAGRIKNAYLAFELLVCNESKIAKQKAGELFQTNLLRKKMQVEITNKAHEFIRSNVECLSLPVLVVYGQNWPSGLIGLVAGNLMKRFKKPVVVLSIVNDLAVGSARSFESFKIFDALNYCRDLFLRWGGHDFAGGLTLLASEINNFVVKINEYAKLKTFAFFYRVDLIVNLGQFNLEVAKSLTSLEPFGKGNEKPIFLFKNLLLLKIVLLKQGAHLRLEFEQNGFKASFLAFNLAFYEFYYRIGSRFNVVASVEINEFLCKQSVSFCLIDLRPVSFNQTNLVESFKFFQQFSLGKNLVRSEVHKFKPVRRDFKLIYLKLKQIKVFNGDFFNFFCSFFNQMSYFKFFLVLKVFVELGLVEFNGFEISLKTLSESSKKLKLESSKIMKKWFD